MHIIIGFPGSGSSGPFPVFVGEKYSDALDAMAASTADHFAIYEGRGRHKNNAQKDINRAAAEEEKPAAAAETTDGGDDDAAESDEPAAKHRKRRYA
jgi:hypothetical protein